MKPADPVAGSRRRFLARAAVFAGSLAIVGCGGTAVRRATSDRWLRPVFGISGAILTDRVDRTGLPLPGGNQTYLSFLSPVAVLAMQGTVFIADAGYRSLFRYERSSGLMHVVPGVRVGAGTVLRSGGDGNVYVLNAMDGEIQRFAVSGRILPVVQPRLPSSRYLDFAVEPLSGRILAVDVQWRVLDRIEPFGNIALALLDLDTPGPLALDGGTLLLADTKCKCINEWRGGRLVRQLAAGRIRLPKALAAERGEIYVLDGFDRSISRVFQDGLETIPAAELNLVAPDQIAVDGDTLYVADGASRMVAAFRIRRHIQ